MNQNNNATVQKSIHKIFDSNMSMTCDTLAVEEPVQINLTATRHSPPIVGKNISITMRTPGDDVDLALGFLYTEGIIKDFGQVISHLFLENEITILLNDQLPLDLAKLERHFYTSSSCGVCGKASIDSIKIECTLKSGKGNFEVHPEVIYHLPKRLKENQKLFESTGGIHAAGLFDLNGELIMLREDVGRHNALDKLIGASLQNGILPLDHHLLLLSGRASFELIQKAAMAGIKMIMAVGAPSSLAVELAEEYDMTLIGFLKNNKFNIYCGKKRIDLN